MIIAADYPFLDILGSMLVFFFWVIWFWTLIVVLTDVFSRSDLSGWAKAGWTVLTIFLPLIGVLAYLVAHGSDMAERRTSDAEQQRYMRDVRTVSHADGGSASEIAHAKELLDNGAIDQQEYDQLKRKALA
jgi:hypothetical protein